MVVNRRIKLVGIITLFLVLSIVIQHYMGNYLYGLAFKLYPFYKHIDQDNAFMYLILHHIFQAIVFLILIWAAVKLFHLKIRDFGFNLNDYKVSIKYTIVFCAVWAVLQFGVSYLMVRNGLIFDMGFPVNTRNVTGYFLFETLLSGTSEELFFRGFVITVLLVLFKNYYKNNSGLYITVILLSTVNFLIGHINYELFPPQITYIDGFQQLTVLIFAVVYGITFLKTKSLLGPILMHNLLNGIITLNGLFCYSMSH